MLKGNKGEWSELYVLFKLLADGKLYAADSELNKMEHIFYDIIKILRKEDIDTIEYRFNEKSQSVDIVKEDNILIVTVPSEEFDKQSVKLYKEIKSQTTSAFELPDIQKFAEHIHINKLKAPSTDKTDIKIQLHDIKNGFDPILGFSIKSLLGQPSTLLNPGVTTNFTYKITGQINDDTLNIFNDNAENTLRQNPNNLFANNCHIEFKMIENKIFNNNLILIDSSLPEIMAYLLLEFYIHGNTNFKNALEKLEEKNPLNYSLEYNHNHYKYKIKHLITEIAIGMTPATVWTGKADATGGYIVVREDGEVLCYHLYNRNEFENYLINNIKFDMASRSRYNYGKIYKEDNEYKIKLNLQIRFIR